MKSILNFLLTVMILLMVFSLKGDETSVERYGVIHGVVSDMDTHAPIPGVEVRVKGLAQKTVSDAKGIFHFDRVPVGTVVLEFTHEQYAAMSKPDIVVKSGKPIRVIMELSFQLKESVTVKGGFFSREETQQSSLSVMTNEEIRRNSGSGGDISRVISALPSIARVNDMVNSLVVRGGSPSENSFFIDNIQIPDINHFTTPGSTGGAIGLLNVDLIRDVRFYAGGFPVQFGDRLSSVMDISFREGSREKIEMQAGLDMAGFGLTGEGPLFNKKGSWLISLRRSYLDLISNAISMGDIVPRYSNFQGKVNFEPSAYTQLTLLAVAGIDTVKWEREMAIEDGNSDYGGIDGSLYTVGLNWRQVWKRGGYSNTSFSVSGIRNASNFYDTDSGESSYSNTTRELQLNIRSVNHFRINPQLQFQCGLELQRAFDDLEYKLPGYTDLWGNQVPDESLVRDLLSWYSGGFAQFTWDPFQKITFKLGGRIQYSSCTDRASFDPRAAFSWQVSANLALNASFGIFRQNLPLTLLNQNPACRDLKTPLARHFILGLSQLLGSGVRLTIDAYYKDYDHFPVDPDQPGAFYVDELIYGGDYMPHQVLIDNGKARSYGVELSLQKKLAEKIYGMVCASWFRSRYKDFNGIWRNRVFDNRVIFAVEGGYKPDHRWELSLRWTYAGGTPYTPFDIEKSTAFESGILDLSRINGERNPSIHSLNVRCDRRFYFKKTNLILYLDIWNAYNQKNVGFRYWNNDENRPDVIYQWRFLPIFGVEFEF